MERLEAVLLLGRAVQQAQLEHPAGVEAVDPEKGARRLHGGPGRHEADELAADDLGSARLGLGRHALDDLVQRGRFPVGDVHAHLDDAGAGQVEAERTDARKAAVALPDQARDLAGDLDALRAQVDVEGDEGPAYAEENRARRWVQPVRAPVGQELTGVDPALQLVRPALAEERRLEGVVRESAVEEDRQLELVADPVCQLQRR